METHEEYAARVLSYDPDVPGLVTAKLAVVAELRIGSWKVQKLEDGGLFVTHWRGAPGGEQMVGFELFDVGEADELRTLLQS